MQEEVAVIEGQVAELKGLVQQQDALNAGLQQRVQTAGEAEARAKVSHHSLLLSLHTQLAALNCHLSHCHEATSGALTARFCLGCCALCKLL